MRGFSFGAISAPPGWFGGHEAAPAGVHSGGTQGSFSEWGAAWAPVSCPKPVSLCPCHPGVPSPTAEGAPELQCPISRGEGPSRHPIPGVEGGAIQQRAVVVVPHKVRVLHRAVAALRFGQGGDLQLVVLVPDVQHDHVEVQGGIRGDQPR